VRKLTSYFGLGHGKGEALLELLFCPAGGEGGLPVEKLVDEDAKGPDIGFGPVYVVDEAFGGHVDGGADVYVLELLPMC
jgi:hypothetical protein